MMQSIEAHLSFGGRLWPRRERVAVLRGFSMRAPSGESTGLIRANGAGNPSFFRACCGFLRLDSRRVLVDGIDPAREPGRASRPILRRWLGMLPFFFLGGVNLFGIWDFSSNGLHGADILGLGAPAQTLAAMALLSAAGVWIVHVRVGRFSCDCWQSPPKR